MKDVKGHALTLNLLGTYLRDAHAGDIRKRDLVTLEEADAEAQGGHAFRVMEAYGHWLLQGSLAPAGSEGARGPRMLALLKLLGLFDRPASADCLGALLKPPTIPELTEPLFTVEKLWLGLKRKYRPIEPDKLNLVLKRLEEAKLLTVNREEGSGVLGESILVTLVTCDDDIPSTRGATVTGEHQICTVAPRSRTTHDRLGDVGYPRCRSE